MHSPPFFAPPLYSVCTQDHGPFIVMKRYDQHHRMTSYNIPSCFTSGCTVSHPKVPSCPSFTAFPAQTATNGPAARSRALSPTSVHTDPQPSVPLSTCFNSTAQSHAFHRTSACTAPQPMIFCLSIYSSLCKDHAHHIHCTKSFLLLQPNALSHPPSITLSHRIFISLAVSSVDFTAFHPAQSHSSMSSHTTYMMSRPPSYFHNISTHTVSQLNVLPHHLHDVSSSSLLPQGLIAHSLTVQSPSTLS